MIAATVDNPTRLLELALGKFRSLSQCPETEAPDSRAERFSQLVNYFELAYVSCTTLGDEPLIQGILTLEPLALNPDLPSDRRDQLRHALDHFINQVSSRKNYQEPSRQKLSA